MVKILISILCGLLTISAMADENEIRIAASSSGMQSVFSKVEQPFTKATGIKIVFFGDNKSQNALDQFKAMLDGKVDATTHTNNFDDFKVILKKNKIESPLIAQTTHRLIGRDMMKVFMNKKNGISEMTSDEVEKVFTGKIRNWKELKGENLPIKIVIQAGRQGTVTMFEKLVARKSGFGGDLVKVDGHDESITEVAKTPGAIGFGPSQTKSDLVTMVKTPPIGRPVYLLTIGKPKPNLEKLINFIQTEGPKLGVGE